MYSFEERPGSQAFETLPDTSSVSAPSLEMKPTPANQPAVAGSRGGDSQGGTHSPEDQAEKDVGISTGPGEIKEERPIYLADVLHEIVYYIQRYFSLPNPAIAMLIACWIANTYGYRAFRYVGYLTLRSATPRCGKTRLLRLIGMLSAGSPRPTTSPTAAVLFRGNRDVLLLDEVDNLRNKDKETHGAIVAVLNAGFEEGGVIERMEKDKQGNFVVQEFLVFGPKALAGIEQVTDTLADRAFVVDMYRSDQRMPRLNMRKLDKTFQGIRNELAKWAETHHEALRAYYDQLPAEMAELAGMDDRFQDVSEPLVVLATLADAEPSGVPPVLPGLLEGLRAVAERRSVSSRERGLCVVLDIVESRWGMKVDEDREGLIDAEEIFIASDQLLAECQGTDELNWIGSTTALAGFLKHFDLAPTPDKRGAKRGYRITREWVNRWRKSYGKESKAA
jgi:hypothetical protein